MFSCWSTISTSSFGNRVHLINPFIDVWTLVFRLMSSLHLPNIYPLSDILLEKIFSHTLLCGHIWLCTLLSRVLNNCWSPFQNDFQILKCYKLKEIWFLWLVILYVFLKHWQTIKIRFSLLIYIFFPYVCHSTCADIRRQLWVPFVGFHLLWGTISLALEQQKAGYLDHGLLGTLLALPPASWCTFWI